MFKFLLFVILNFNFLLIYAQNSDEITENDVAYLYLFREYSANGSFVKYKIKDDKKIIYKLANNKYTVLEIKAGIHLISVKNYLFQSKKIVKPVLIDAKAGKNYYLKIRIEEDRVRFISYIYFVEIQDKEASNLIEKLIEQ